jgi:hypothetical protein
MKKLIVPLLAGTILAGGIAIAATAKHDGPPDRADMQRHHAEMCSGIVAHEAGAMAFLETRLALTPAQSGAFNAWKAVKLSEAKGHSAKCSMMAMPDRDHMPSPIDHMALEEEMLKARLADLQTERPVLAAFYSSLNDVQKREFAMAGMRMHGGMGVHHGWFGHGHGMMGGDHGMGGPGMDDSAGPPPPGD